MSGATASPIGQILISVKWPTGMRELLVWIINEQDVSFFDGLFGWLSLRLTTGRQRQLEEERRVLNMTPAMAAAKTMLDEKEER